MASLPTREIHMAAGDVADLLAMAIYVSFTSSKPEETPRFALIRLSVCSFNF